jgi:mono/diheme cytochrome c family protein
MRNAYLLPLLGFLALLLSGCGEGEDNPNQDAPYFDSIGTPTATAGDSINFTVVATDPNQMNVTLTYDGTLGPNANPFNAGATFNATTGAFSWNTDANDIGSYSVQFKATNNAVPPLSTSVNVTINVLAVANNDPTGEDLYNQHCQSCHGPEGVNGSRSAVQCSLEISIREALGLVQGIGAASGMGGIAGQLSDVDIADIADYLQNVQPQNC